MIAEEAWNDAMCEAINVVSIKDYEGINIYPHFIDELKKRIKA